MGLCIFVENFLGEIPIFYIAHHIIQYLGSVLSLCLSLAAFALRYFAYGYWLNEHINQNRYWDILLVELLQGLTFSLFYCVMTNVAQEYAEKCEVIKRELDMNGDNDNQLKPSATMQALMSACYEGIGLGIGSLLGGYIIKNRDIFSIWKLGAYFSVTLILFNLIIEFFKFLYKRKHSRGNSTIQT